MKRDLTPEFWADLAKLLPRRGAVVLDVGAHLLEEAQQLVPLLELPTWHAFEPNPECYRACLDQVVPYLRPRAKELLLYCAAVGASAGEAQLHLSAKRDGQPWTASSSTRAPKNVLAAYPWLCFPKQVTVPVTTLDDHCRRANLSRVNLVKMDVQGAEIDVIRGGQETFAKTTYVVTEVVENEEYEGQRGLAGLLEALPGRWELVERTTCDALLKRKD